MTDGKFDVTFIRGPRDLSPWKKASRELMMLLGSPQNDEDALQAHSGYLEKRHGIATERFPNAVLAARRSK